MVIDELIKVFGNDRVGIKISPLGRYADQFDSDPIALYTYFLKQLNKRQIAFVEIRNVSQMDIDIDKKAGRKP